jgi:hypothetical protein
MAARDTGGAATGGPRIRVKKKPQSTAPPPTPDQQDRNRQPRTPPPPVKVRAYAHPQRPGPQKVFHDQQVAAQREKEHQQATRRAIRHVKVTPVPSPDARDSTRPPAQQAHDRQVVARTVRESREKAVRKEHRGSGTRFIQHVAAGGLRTNSAATAPPTMGVPTITHKHGGGGAQFAVIRPIGAVKLDRSTAAGRLALNVAPDAAELAVTTPSSVAKLASTAVHHPKKVPGMLAKPYVDLAKHPVESFTERPVTSTLMLQPVVRVPGRALGRAARIAGKQTLERPAASLPGTSVKVPRTGSRDFFVRAVQARHDKHNPNPVATVKDVQRRVDAHAEHQRQLAQRATAVAVRDAKKRTKGRPKAERVEAVRAARETAREHAHEDAGDAFVHEFGANARPSTGHVERSLARTVREHAFERVGAARRAVNAANATHDAALTAARVAREKARTSPKLASLETKRRDALRDLARAQRQHQQARVGQGVAKGRAQVLADKVTDPRSAAAASGAIGTVAKRRGAVTDAADAVRAAREHIRGLDRQIAAERQRISGVPPAEHQALLHAIHDRAGAHAALVIARAEHATARAEDVAVKKRPVTLVSPQGTGRSFAHKQDARRVADRLNEAAAQITRGGKTPVRYVVHDPDTPGMPAAIERAPATVPVEFTVRQVGERWAAVPKIANERMHPTNSPDAPLSHATVGSSKSTVAKAMRTTRGAFTNATLPLSPKWLGGQAAESTVRAIVAGAGPLDILRFHRTVKALNEKHPGRGDELHMRVTGANSTLISGAARDFAQGKSLAEEFRGTPLAQPAAVATRAGRTAPLRGVRAGWRGYTTFVLDRVNGTIENAARQAMAGQAIRGGPLMERRLNGLSDRAIQDAADGLRGTHAQVQLGRTVNRMYGRYNGFPPEMRSLILHWTPFLPWTLNVVTFLTKVLPVDHPVITSLLASTSVATEDWRKANRLSLRQEGHLPLYMLGSDPVKGGYRALGRYTPFGITDPAESVASLVLPQASSPLLNLRGVGWTGDRLKRPGYAGKEFTTPERIARAITSAIEAQVPGVSQAGRITGLTPRYVDKKTEIPSLKNRLLHELPGYPMKTPAERKPSSSSSSGRIKIPGTSTSSGRIQVPGVTGRVKIPGG